MKNLYLILLSISISTSALAQELMYFDTTPSWCGTDAFTEEYFRENPGAREAFMNNMERIHLAEQHSESARGADDIEPFVIPVVVHVVHDNGTGNISLEQIQDGINLLNEDYRRTNPDASETRPEFQAIAGAAPFEFRLAKIDPSGNPTDGVVRTDDASRTYNVRNAVKGVSYWNSSRYFNIWLVNSIQTSSGGTVLGYAQFPGTGSWNTYGLVMRHDQFGRIGTSNSDGRTLTHEMGHCLGLFHTFQSGCGSNCSNSGDQICDTPPVSTSSWSCNFNQNTCSNDANGYSITSGGDTISLDSNYPDQIQNYMSYDDCQNMFSKGQVSRMVAVMNQFSRLQNLASEGNLDASGVSTLYSANFESNKNVVCVGDAVAYSDLSFYGQSMWAWTLPGANPDASNAKNPSVIYTEPGVYSARLSVSNGVVIRNKFVDNKVLVSPKRGYFNDFSQDFEDGLFPSAKWLGVDEDNDGVAWELANVGQSGNNSIKLANFNASEDNTDALYTSTYDLASYQSASLDFSYAFAEKEISNDDRLIISYSTDCGESWTNFWNVSNGNLATSGAIANSEFVPSQGDWKQESRNLLSSMLVEGLQFRFLFLSGGGNSIYIDDFNIDVEWKSKLTLQSPAPGDEIDAFDLTLDWKPFPDADEYEYELSSDNNFTSVVKTGKLASLGMNADDLDTQIPVEGLSRGQLYFWRVRSIEAGTPGEWSEVWFFKISQTVSQQEVLSNNTEIKIFPNPAQEEVQLRLQGSDTEYKVLVTDLNGKLMLMENVSMQNGVHEQRIDSRSWPKGVYIVNVSSESQNLNRKLIIQ